VKKQCKISMKITISWEFLKILASNGCGHNL
jgi:hypothetical protein